MNYKNRFKLIHFNQISGTEEKKLDSFLNSIKSAINMADRVYIYRTLNHFSEKTDLVIWAEQHVSNQYEFVEIDCPKYNNKIVFQSCDKSKVIEVDLTESKNRASFTSMFKVSCRDHKKRLTREQLNNMLLVDNPLYDQFDFLFVLGETILLWTEIHQLMIFTNGGYAE